MAKTTQKIEFGDFQTPLSLASKVVSSIQSIDEFDTLIEPTCGVGTFLIALIESSVKHEKLKGWEINPLYAEEANKALNNMVKKDINIVKKQDFFQIDWNEVKKFTNEKTLFIGNPPWVTNSELGKLLSKNLPEKENFQGLSGLEAMTGKSNFDISEWMMIKLLALISGKSSGIAFLIKTSVARKLIQYINDNELLIGRLSIKEIDAKKYFGVSVDACLFEGYGVSTASVPYECKVYKDKDWATPYKIMGVIEDKLVSNLNDYASLRHIDKGCEFKWRSGVKHDASKVMELNCCDDKLINGNKDEVSIEPTYLYPMYKSSNIAKPSLLVPTKYMVVTQQKIGEETKSIQMEAPLTWDYLVQNSEKLDGRKSSIYKSAPRFAVFGVGDYTFKPYKVVISGMYNNLEFKKIGLFKDKPIVLDDTCYMLCFDKIEEVNLVHTLLTSDYCRRFINSIVFTDNKRPITAALLNRINLKELAKLLDLSEAYETLFSDDAPQLLELL